MPERWPEAVGDGDGGGPGGGPGGRPEGCVDMRERGEESRRLPVNRFR